MDSSPPLPTLRVTPDQIASRVLLVGDPKRAKAAASLLDDVSKVGANREYVTFTGTRQGLGVSICSHGVGSAGAGICFEEVARAGAKVMLRAGSCGAIQDGIEDGDLVVATAAVCDDGLTPRLVPNGYPAVAHYGVTNAILGAVSDAGLTAHTGIVLATDLFYASKAQGVDWETWKASRVTAVEMELGAFFVIASLHDIRAGGILTVDGNPTRAAQDMSQYDPYREVVEQGVATMLEIAISALTRVEDLA